MAELRILTLNCLWHSHARRRLRFIAQRIDSVGVDFACLQEVIWRRDADMLQFAISTRPHVAYQPFGPAVKGGLVTLSRWPVVRRTFDVFEKRGWWNDISAADRWIRKGFLTTWHSTPAGVLAVVNTHLLSNYDNDWSDTNRYVAHQAAELRQLAAAVESVDRSEAVVVAGDFNVPTASPFYSSFVQSLAMIDASAALPSPDSMIDHVLVRPAAGQRLTFAADLPFVGATAEVNGRHIPLSDHAAITTRLVFPGQAS